MGPLVLLYVFLDQRVGLSIQMEMKLGGKVVVAGSLQTLNQALHTGTPTPSNHIDNKGKIAIYRKRVMQPAGGRA